jgi:MFS family permease
LAARPAHFFYGWYIVGVVFFTNFVAIGCTVHALNVMIWPMDRDLGWGRATLSAVISVGPIVSVGLALGIGNYLDRHGARVPMLVGLALLSAGLFAVGQVREPWQYFAVWLPFVTAGTALTAGLVGSVTISNWFVRMRGRAMANATMGQSVAAMLMPAVVVLALGLGSWRYGWLMLSVIPLLLLGPVALFIRRRPEDLGLHPDGEPVAVSALSGRLRRDDQTWTRHRLLRTRNFWLVVAAYAISGFGTSALAVHVVAHLADSGLGVEGAAVAASAMAVAGLVSRPVWGFCLERLGAKAMSITSFGLHILLLALLLNVRAPLVLPLAIVARGFAQGSILPVQETVWADFFGRPSLGLVRSLAMPFTLIIAAGGPLFAGAVYDRTHSYQPAFVIFIFCFAAAIGLMLYTRPGAIGRGT